MSFLNHCFQIRAHLRAVQAQKFQRQRSKGAPHHPSSVKAPSVQSAGGSSSSSAAPWRGSGGPAPSARPPGITVFGVADYQLPAQGVNPPPPAKNSREYNVQKYGGGVSPPPASVSLHSGGSKRGKGGGDPYAAQLQDLRSLVNKKQKR